jgi:hypothetical protein
MVFRKLLFILTAWFCYLQVFQSYGNVKMNQGERRGGLATKVLTSFTVDICFYDYNMYAL